MAQKVTVFIGSNNNKFFTTRQKAQESIDKDIRSNKFTTTPTEITAYLSYDGTYFLSERIANAHNRDIIRRDGLIKAEKFLSDILEKHRKKQQDIGEQQ